MASTHSGIKNRLPCEYSFQTLRWSRAMLRYIGTELFSDYCLHWSARSKSLLSAAEMAAKHMFADFEEAVYELAQRHNFKDGMKLYWHAFMDRVGKYTKQDDSAATLMLLTFEHVFPNARDMASLQNYNEFALQVVTPGFAIASISFHAECAEMAFNMVADAYLEQQEWGQPWKIDRMYSHYNGLMDCTGLLFDYMGDLLK